jgi:glycosyltransferase involved in cell wall biosynthesis
MHLGLPVVALATTEVVEAVPRAAGVVSNRIERLKAGLKRFTRDPDAAREAGVAGRAAAMSRYRLDRFLADWDALFEEVVA